MGFPAGTNNSSLGRKGNVASSVSGQSSDKASMSSLYSSQDGEWDVCSKKSKNRARRCSANSLSVPQKSNQNVIQCLGMHPKPQIMGNYMAPPPSNPKVKWSSIVGTSQHATPENIHININHRAVNNDDDDDDDSDDMEDTDDDVFGDEIDSEDSGQTSHATRKKTKWFKIFFKMLDGLTKDELIEPRKPWKCPACQGGPGAINRYAGLEPLMTHAKTKLSKRVKLHRDLAELLEEELRTRGIPVEPAVDSIGKWEGLKETNKDYEIVWPPMVMIMNTRLEQDENGKWRGMGNQVLLDYFHAYAAIKARHSYGSQGHRGMSVLIFESSARGFLEAEQLHKHFIEQGTDRNAWYCRPVLFCPGGKRRLYGFLAIKEDLDDFNKPQGKSKLKFEIRSHFEQVVSQIHQMTEDNQELEWFKKKYEREHERSEAFGKSLHILGETLRLTSEENRIVRERTKTQHEQNKEEMDYQEQFFSEQIKTIHEAKNMTRVDLENVQLEKQSSEDLSIANPKCSEEVNADREHLMKVHMEEMAALDRRYWKEKVELQEMYNVKLNQLMEKYNPDDDTGVKESTPSS